MKGIEIFRTKLKEKRRIFYPGEAVYGLVILRISQEIKLRDLSIQCHGEACVNWSESTGSCSRFHHNKEQYFHAVASIAGQVPTLKALHRKYLSLHLSRRMSAGDYGFSFKFIIPDKYLPPSFEGTHGYILYWIRAVIDRGVGKRAVKTKPAKFIIGDLVGIGEFENISKSVQSEQTKSVGCCPCRTEGSLSIGARTDKAGYKQGETVQVYVSISNQTRHHVTAVSITLVQRTVYIDIEKKKTFTENTIASTAAGYVTQHSDIEFAAIPLAIAHRETPTLLTCKCLSVTYCVKITAKLKRSLTKDSVIELPIIIASAPQKPSKQQGFRPQKRGTIFYLIGTPSSRQQKPHICFTATHSPCKYPRPTAIHNEAAMVFFMLGSPVRCKKRVSLV